MQAWIYAHIWTEYIKNNTEITLKSIILNIYF